MNLASLTFANPNWAWWLFVLPVIALFKIAADSEARRVTTVFASSERLRVLMQDRASVIRSGVRFGLQLLGLGFLILTLTRPQVGDEEKKVDQSGRNILIAIDCSKSMLANDVKPNRLTRAKLAAQDLLEKLSGDRVGLIAFAGRAFLQAPLTTDHEAVTESIQSLDYTTIPRGGSSLGAAVALALNTVEKMPGRLHGLILFTDGQETDDAMLTTAKDAREKNLLVLPVGVGTAEGELIPDPEPLREGDFLRDEDGNVIKSRLESGALRELAAVSGGEYIELNTQALTQTLVNSLLSNLDRHRAASRQITRRIDRYQWPLFAGIVCLIMSLVIHPSARRQTRAAPLPVDPMSTVHQPRTPPLSQTALLAGLLLALPLPGMAVSEKERMGDLGAARQAYDQGRFDQAKKYYQKLAQQIREREGEEERKAANSRLHRAWNAATDWLGARDDDGRDEINYGLGASSLRLKEYDTASKAFSEALQSGDPGLKRRAQRGLATSLYEQGLQIMIKQPERAFKAWTDSRDHFDSALKITPEDAPEYKELKENRDFVQMLLDQLKEQLARAKEQQEKDQKKRNEQKGKGRDKGDSKGSEKPKDIGEGEPPPEGLERKMEALQKLEEVLPEGQIRAGEAGAPGEKMQQKTPEEQRNEKTGFTPQEARDQLRTYADDQKYEGRSTQYLMRDERPAGGKDY